MLDPTTLYVLAIIFLATLIRSAFGFGEALIAVPLLALRLPLTTAVPLAVLISITVAFIVILQDFRHIHVKSAGGLLVATLVGTPLGLLLLATANERLIKILLAALLLIFALYSLLARARLHLKTDHKAGLLTAGFLAGILGGLYGMNGPPVVVYGSLRRWTPQHFRATLQAYFLPSSLLSLAGYLLIGFWNPSISYFYFLSLPLTLLALVLGRAINRRLHGDTFYKFLYIGLLAIGVLLLVQSANPFGPVTSQ
jgi:uncharacterized protein